MSSRRPAEIRASDAEREQAGQLLREATVEGRLTLDEFSERYMLAQQARTRGDLEAIAHDLPKATFTDRHRPISKLHAVLSGIDQNGAWQLAPETTVTAILGSCKLDLRRATISSEITTIDSRIICGSLDLIVPEGVDIEIDAAMILSGRSVKLSHSTASSSLKPLIRITGTVFAGSITVRDTPKLGERLREVATGLLTPPRNDQSR